MQQQIDLLQQQAQAPAPQPVSPAPQPVSPERPQAPVQAETDSEEEEDLVLALPPTVVKPALQR